MILLTIISSLIILWYLLKFLSYFSGSIKAFVRKLSIYTRFAHQWIISAPATFVYTAVFWAFTLVQHTTSSHLIDILTNHNSTSIVRLSRHPIAMLIDSAFWVSGKGAGLSLYILLFVTIVAAAERRYGTPRIVLIAISGHVFGSLLTVFLEIWAINSGWASQTLTHMTDVGVSYILIAGCAAALLLLKGLKRWFGGFLFVLFLMLLVLISGNIWDLGHLFAALSSLLTTELLRTFPLRKVKSAREMLEEIRALAAKSS